LPTPVISLIKSEGNSARLAPKVSKIIFAFCDLRKCCKVFDGIEDPQEIRRRYQDLQRLLDILSSNLVAQGAIIEDLEGDAVKGLWGWPDELDAADLVEKCINAARLIMEGFDRYEPSVDARIDKLEFGMGIAGGDAVVGRLGSAGIFKISSQGHAPNLSQRLEELTKRKYFGQPILVNDFIHDLARPECCHRLARVRPRGMQTPVNVSRILPKRLDVTDRNLVQDYNAGLALFESGNFAEANRNLQRINHFRPASYLIETMAAHNFKVPDGWDGTLKLADKPS
jgi:adenylate cyclase